MAAKEYFVKFGFFQARPVFVLHIIYIFFCVCVICVCYKHPKSFHADSSPFELVCLPNNFYFWFVCLKPFLLGPDLALGTSRRSLGKRRQFFWLSETDASSELHACICNILTWVFLIFGTASFDVNFFNNIQVWFVGQVSYQTAQCVESQTNENG